MDNTPKETNVEYYERTARAFQALADDLAPGPMRDEALRRARWAREQAVRELELARVTAKLLGLEG